MTRRVAVRAIVLRDGKLLCVRLKAYKDSLRENGTDYWCLPGGGLDDGESLVAGIEREMIEETGIRPVVGKLLYVQQFAHGEQEYLEFFFHVTNSSDYIDVDLSKTTHGQEEIAEIDFIDPSTAHVLPDFLGTESLTEFTSSEMPTRVISRL